VRLRAVILPLESPLSSCLPPSASTVPVPPRHRNVTGVSLRGFRFSPWLQDYHDPPVPIHTHALPCLQRPGRPAHAHHGGDAILPRDDGAVRQGAPDLHHQSRRIDE